MSEMLGEVMAEGGLEALEPEDELDAFNDETFGGDGLGEQWEENAHEQLAMMTEEERIGLKQSDAFFNFGSDGEVSFEHRQYNHNSLASLWIQIWSTWAHGGEVN